MRIPILKDSQSTVSKPTTPCHLTLVAANDGSDPGVTAPNPAKAYLLSLSPGSRRAMTQALQVIASAIEAGATTSTLDWSGVGYGEVSMVRAHLASKYAPNTANKCLAALRGVMRATFRLGLIDSDTLSRAIDVRRVRGGRVVKGRALDSIEIARLITACDRTTELGARNAAIVAIGFGGGLRRAELVGLDVADVLEEGQSLRVHGKGNKERFVYLAESIRLHLVAWLQHRGEERGPLFCPASRNGVRVRRLTEQTIYDVIQALASKAGTGRVAPHDLRRTFVSLLLDQGVPLSTVSAMAGHADVSTTARYDVRGERVKREASKLLNVAMPT